MDAQCALSVTGGCLLPHAEDSTSPRLNGTWYLRSVGGGVNITLTSTLRPARPPRLFLVVTSSLAIDFSPTTLRTLWLCERTWEVALGRGPEPVTPNRIDSVPAGRVPFVV